LQFGKYAIYTPELEEPKRRDDSKRDTHTHTVHLDAETHTHTVHPYAETDPFAVE
jgi:hypothetical protein